jgi:hypothetical protein
MKYRYAYRNIAIPATIVTCLACFNLWLYPSPSVFLYLLWCKLITTALLMAYIHYFRPTVLLFFMNLGIGKTEFYSGIVGIDLLISVVCFAMILILQ